MDNTDIKILKILQNNARTTVSDISSEISLSVPATAERIKKLESNGIISKYTAILNPGVLKKELTALIFISLERSKYTDAFTEFILQEQDILECHYLAGDFDYSLKIMTKNTSTLESLLTKIKSFQGIRRTNTIIVLSTAKNSHSVMPDVKV